MSSSSDRRVGRCAPAVLAALMVVAPGCDCEDRCDGVEVCNYRDDDCDGVTDEGFVGPDGRYSTAENCGACGVVCADVFPTALETACVETDAGFRCEIAACPVGTHLAGTGACVPEVDPLCFPCALDADCAVYAADALCLATGTGERRCATACGSAASVDCPGGFFCDAGPEGLGWCRPSGGVCGCTPEAEGTSFPCLVDSGAGQVCAGRQICDGERLGPCEAVFEEACDGLDNDCDGDTDEDFRIEGGAYVHADHCGACNVPCVPPGPNMEAECLAGPPIVCERRCREGFVDLDRIEANGCECERTVGTWPPSRLGVDADCDGTIDDSTEFVFVTPAGSDSNPGSLVLPMRTVQAAVTRASREGKSVLVARGRYAGPVDMAAGTSIFGGYAPDFSDRDVHLHATVIENVGGTAGTPLLACREIDVATEVDGLTIAGSDATTSGQGATAVYLDRCTDRVRLTGLVVYAGRGAAGAEGASSSQNLARWGMTSLRDLDGRSAAAGRDGVVTYSNSCSGTTVAGGSGGLRACPGSGNTLDGGSGGAAACPNTGCLNTRPCPNAGCTDYTVGGVCDMETVLRLAVANPAAGDGRGPGAGRAGQATYDAVTNRSSCSFCDDNPTLPREGGHGTSGASGVSGTGGAGCGSAEGGFDARTGLRSAPSGTGGTDGTDGGGGGGGTCGSGYDALADLWDTCGDALGGSGGGGGSGGCGAPGASGGQGGGASVGVAIRLRTGATTGPVLTGLEIVTAPGGAGGDGGQGATGGTGGAGASGGRGTFWCTRRGGRGGDGGRGGAGGGGGGGCGGSVAGIEIVADSTGVEPYAEALRAGNAIDGPAAPGIGGAGGFAPGAAGGAGLSGTAATVRVIRD